MLALKVKKILLENKFSQTRPWSITQLAAMIDISDQHLRRLMEQARPQDIDRIAKGLGVESAQLN